MLSLGRNPGQYVVIGDDIVIQVIYSSEGLLRLAIDAPKDVAITRGEAFELTNEAPQCIQKLRRSDLYQPLNKKNVTP